MKKYRAKKTTAGMTLMELMFAVSISSILIATIFTTWSYINKHVAVQELKSDIRYETARIADEITRNLKRTPALLNVTDNSVTLIDHNSGDTLKYAFDGEELTKNETPVKFDLPGGKITSLELRDISEHADASNISEYILLEITLTSEDTRNLRISDTCRVILNVRKDGMPFDDGEW